MLKGIDLSREIIKKYNQHPRRWYCFLKEEANLEKKLLINSKNSWIIYENKWSSEYERVGIEIKTRNLETSNFYEFGYRYLGDSLIDYLLNGSRRSIDKILSRFEPEKINEKSNKTPVIGPIYSPKREGVIEIIDDAVELCIIYLSLQLEISSNLSRLQEELEKLTKDRIGFMFG